MTVLMPTVIERLDGSALRIAWSDGFSAIVPLEVLRHYCPCAYCKGEQVFGTVVMLPLQQFSAGMYELRALEPVGNYGIRARWADGHDSGIYTWQLLRQIAELAQKADIPSHDVP